MADAIHKPSSSNTIHNYGAVTQCTGGNFANFREKNVDAQELNDFPKPDSSTIDSKYDTRLDDPRYYSGDAVT